MKDNAKIGIALGVGLLTGGIAGFLLNSDKGRKFRKDTNKKLKKLEEEARETFKAQSANFNENFSKVMNEAKSSFDAIMARVNGSVDKVQDELEDAAEGVEKDFKKGASKAKAVIENNVKSSK